MSALNPASTTVGDVITQALKECGAWGVGQTPLAEDSTDAQIRLQWMLQEWERKSWIVWHKVTYLLTSTGATSYTVGPGGQINTSVVSAWVLAGALISVAGTGYVVNDTITLPSGAVLTVLTTGAGGAVKTFGITTPGIFIGNLPTTLAQLTSSGGGTGFVAGTPTWTAAPGQASAASGVRPAKLQSAFLRQIVNSPVANQIDFPCKIISSMEDYNAIAIKGLVSFPTSVFYDPKWPLGDVFFWPIPQANIYAIGVTFLEQLAPQFATQGVNFVLPYEYYSAMLYNLALRLRPKYGIPTPPGDMVQALARDTMNVIRNANSAIAELSMPEGLSRPGIYNIFSDRYY